MDVLSQVDLAFCVDLTSSMTPFIEAARARMSEILAALSEAVGANLRVALVGYRDYGTKVKTVEVSPFTAEVADTRKALAQLKVGSPPENIDAAEAVLAGLQSCYQDLEWRAQAVRVVVLVGDAPPHGTGITSGPFPDRFPDRDPTGLTVLDVSARLESSLITLHGLGMLPSVHPMYDGFVVESFSTLARCTGGDFRTAKSSRDAMAVVEAIGTRVFGEMDFERRVWTRMQQTQPGWTPASPGLEEHMPELCKELNAPEHAVRGAVRRLRRRLLPG